MRKIILTLGELSVVLGQRQQSEWADSSWRSRLTLPEFGRSADGALDKSGPFYEPPHVWNLSARLDAATFDKLDSLFELWLQTDQPNIVLSDQVQVFKEPVTVGTRPIATGGEVIADGMLQYFAKFNVYFSDKPSFAVDGRFKKTSIVLQEREKLSRA